MGVNEISKNDVIKEAIEQFKSRIEFNIDGEDEQEMREKYDARIRAKLEVGKRLSAKEMQYLKKYNPVLYTHAVRIEIKRRSVEEQLKHARSKQEVQDIQCEEIATIRKTDPVKKYMVAAVCETIKAFKETEGYKRLPETDAEAKKKGNRAQNNKVRKENDEESSDEGYVITYEVSSGSYQMAYADNATDSVGVFFA